MKVIQELRAQGDLNMQWLMDNVPFTRFLNVQIDRKGSEVTTILPFDEKLIGNTNLPALHGGALGAFLEITSVVQLLVDTSLTKLPKTVDISIDYLRSGRPQDCYGRAQVTRLGRRVANVHAEIWQDEKSKPIAVARGQFLLSPDE